MSVFRSGDYDYFLNDDGTATISLHYGLAEHLEIPSVVDGHTITCLDEEAFCDEDSLLSVTLPDSIVRIEKNPFSGCSHLTQFHVSENHPCYADIDGVLFDKPGKTLVCYPCGRKSTLYTVPEGTVAIGEAAFRSCDSLTKVCLPESLTRVGESAFEDCDSLTDVRLPKLLTRIGENAFGRCWALEDVAVPDGVKEIENSAFFWCAALKRVRLPAGLTRIGTSAFCLCKSLTSIELPQALTSIGEGAFNWCASLKRVTLPDGLKHLGQGAFFRCTALESIRLPEGLVDMGERIFDNCPSLKNVVVASGSPAEEYCRENRIRHFCQSTKDKEGKNHELHG